MRPLIGKPASGEYVSASCYRMALAMMVGHVASQSLMASYQTYTKRLTGSILDFRRSKYF